MGVFLLVLISYSFILRSLCARTVSYIIFVFLLVNLEVDYCIFLVRRMQTRCVAQRESGIRQCLGLGDLSQRRRAKLHAASRCASSFAVAVPESSTALRSLSPVAPLVCDMLVLAPNN